jgi:DNA replication and repair protein RecF
LALVNVKCTDFRCLESAELALDRGNNLIYGANASGKTSILEAIAYLGRARSFRGASVRELTRHGADEFTVVGTVASGGRNITLGVRNGRSGQEVRAGGDKSASAAPLAEALPLQVIDPDVHGLVAGGPEGRRRFIDWIAFHVEHHYLDDWRRYRRALKQRNAALKNGSGAEALQGWDAELASLGLRVDEIRRRMLDIVTPSLREFGEELLGAPVDVEYQQGWGGGRSLAEALAEGGERDRQLGSTQSGPHRADLALRYDERRARKLVSRGQQKLLACALILAATETVQTHLERPLLLLLDDPAAELDRDAVERLMGAVEGLGCQVIATTLDPAQALFSAPPVLFHVEHGVVRRDA